MNSELIVCGSCISLAAAELNSADYQWRSTTCSRPALPSIALLFRPWRNGRNLRCERTHTSSWKNDPSQIQWIRARNLDRQRCSFGTSNGTQQVQSLRNGELLTRETRDEAATSNLTASLHAPQHVQQLTPGRCSRLSREQVTK